MALFLAVCILCLSLVIIYLVTKLQSERAKHTLSQALSTEVAPSSHNVPPVNIDTVMADSDDPVWGLVVDCRAVGLMGEWLNKRPQFKGTQAHRKYSEFATWILNLPESQRTVSGIRQAIRNG